MIPLILPLHIVGNDRVHPADAAALLVTILTGITFAAGLAVFAWGRAERRAGEQGDDDELGATRR